VGERRDEGSLRRQGEGGKWESGVGGCGRVEMSKEMVLEVSCNFAFDDNAPLPLHFWNSNFLPFPLSLLQIIRELREEVERLRLMMMGGGAGGEGGGISAKELSELKEKLRISEDLMSEMSKSWEQKLLETQRIHQVWLVVLVYCSLL